VQSAVYTANTVSLMVPVAPVLVNGLLPTCDSSRHGHAPQNQYCHSLRMAQIRLQNYGTKRWQ
jgi:hypothetical protein